MIWFGSENGAQQYATIWKVEDKGKFSEVRLSTSRKDKRDDEYKNSNWSFVRFVGDAHKVASTLNPKDRVIIRGGIDLEPYTDSAGVQQFPKTARITVFECSLADNDAQPKAKKGMDTPPKMDESEEEMPF